MALEGQHLDHRAPAAAIALFSPQDVGNKEALWRFETTQKQLQLWPLFTLVVIVSEADAGVAMPLLAAAGEQVFHIGVIEDRKGRAQTIVV